MLPLKAPAHILSWTWDQEWALYCGSAMLQITVGQSHQVHTVHTTGFECHAVHSGGAREPFTKFIQSIRNVSSFNGLSGKESFKRIKREIAEYITRSGPHTLTCCLKAHRDVWNQVSQQHTEWRGPCTALDDHVHWAQSTPALWRQADQDSPELAAQDEGVAGFRRDPEGSAQQSRKFDTVCSVWSPRWHHKHIVAWSVTSSLWRVKHFARIAQLQVFFVWNLWARWDGACSSLRLFQNTFTLEAIATSSSPSYILIFSTPIQTYIKLYITYSKWSVSAGIGFSKNGLDTVHSKPLEDGASTPERQALQSLAKHLPNSNSRKGRKKEKGKAYTKEKERNDKNEKNSNSLRKNWTSQDSVPSLSASKEQARQWNKRIHNSTQTVKLQHFPFCKCIYIKCIYIYIR